MSGTFIAMRCVLAASASANRAQAASRCVVRVEAAICTKKGSAAVSKPSLLGPCRTIAHPTTSTSLNAHSSSSTVSCKLLQIVTAVQMILVVL